jgi:hypothetical protein
MNSYRGLIDDSVKVIQFVADKVIGDTESFKVVFADTEPQIKSPNGRVVKNAVTDPLIVVHDEGSTVLMMLTPESALGHDAWVVTVGEQKVEISSYWFKVGYSFKGEAGI